MKENKRSQSILIIEAAEQCKSIAAQNQQKNTNMKNIISIRFHEFQVGSGREFRDFSAVLLNALKISEKPKDKSKTFQKKKKQKFFAKHTETESFPIFQPLKICNLPQMKRAETRSSRIEIYPRKKWSLT